MSDGMIIFIIWKAILIIPFWFISLRLVLLTFLII